jgi:hypothetical protein
MSSSVSLPRACTGHLKAKISSTRNSPHGVWLTHLQAGKTGSVCLVPVAPLGASGPLAFQPTDCLFLLLPAFIRWFCVELLVFESPDDAFTFAHAFEALQPFFQAFVLIDEYFSHDSSTKLYQHHETVRPEIEPGKLAEWIKYRVGNPDVKTKGVAMPPQRSQNT